MHNLLIIAFIITSSTIFTTILIKIALNTFLKRFGQTVRTDVLDHHKSKEGTPTMGGGVIVVTMILCWLFFGSSSLESYVLLLALIGFAFIGFVDDCQKLIRGRGRGITVGQKTLLMLIVSIAIIYFLPDSQYWQIPFSNVTLDLGVWGPILALLALIGTANAVNLTDGLDGLVLMPIILAFSSFLVITLVLKIDHNFSWFLAGIIGSCAGVLLFNINPAKLFLGDTGALGLGGALATLALMLKKAFLLLPLGLVFVVEAMSVILQVISFKFRGKRIFKMSPLHHHFELSGIRENTIVSVVWLLTFIVALLTVIFEVAVWL